MEENKENGETTSEENVNKENMASYSSVLKSNPQTNNEISDTDSETETEPDSGFSTVKPVFLLESDYYGGTIVEKQYRFLMHKEVYNQVGKVIPVKNLIGLQRIRGMWRIYPDSQQDREKLVTNGVDIRDKHLPIYSRNPWVTVKEKPNTIKIRIKNVPCSADDGQITRYLENKGCTIHTQFRERLRIYYKLTNCQTGDRIYICDEFTTPLPRTDKIGKYLATIIHKGQPFAQKKPIKCNKCLEEGHKIADCPNEWKCRQCFQFGHKENECDNEFSEKEESDHDQDEDQTGNESEEGREDDEDQNQDQEEGEPEQTQPSQSILVPPKIVNEKETQHDSDEPKGAKSSEKQTNTAKDKESDMTNPLKERKKTGPKKDKQNKNQDNKQTLDKYFKCDVSETPKGKTGKKTATTPTNELHNRSGPAKKAKGDIPTSSNS